MTFQCYFDFRQVRLINVTYDQERRHGFESGGDKFCERSEQKIFLTINRPITYKCTGITALQNGDESS